MGIIFSFLSPPLSWFCRMRAYLFYHSFLRRLGIRENLCKLKSTWSLHGDAMGEGAKGVDPMGEDAFSPFLEGSCKGQPLTKETVVKERYSRLLLPDALQGMFPKMLVPPEGRQTLFNHVCQVTKQRWQVVRRGLSAFCMWVYYSCIVRVSDIEMLPSISKKQNASRSSLWDRLFCITLSLSWALKLYFVPIWSRKSFFLCINLNLCLTNLKVVRKLFSSLCTEGLPCNLQQSN